MKEDTLAVVLLSLTMFIMNKQSLSQQESFPSPHLSCILPLRKATWQISQPFKLSGRDTPEHLANGCTVPTLIRSSLETAVLNRWLSRKKPGNKEEMLGTAVFALLDSEFHRKRLNSFVKQCIHLLWEWLFFLFFVCVALFNHKA